MFLDTKVHDICERPLDHFTIKKFYMKNKINNLYNLKTI
jgi:hypothetical protein